MWLDDGMTTTTATYTEYLTYVANLKGTKVQPYTEKQWDTMPAVNKFGINLAIRQQQARLAGN